MSKRILKIDIKSLLLILLFSAVFFTTYLTRKSYSVIIPQLINDTGMSQNLISIPLTVLFVCYGIGLVFAGIIIDKFKQKLILPACLFLSGIINLLMPVISNTIAASAILWGINGLCICFAYPILIKYVGGSLDKKYFEKATTSIFVGAMLGQAFLSVLAFLFVKYSNYSYLFYFCGSFSILISIIVLAFTKYLTFETKTTDENKDALQNNSNIIKPKTFIIILFVLILIALVCAGSLRDSIENWTPTFINQAFNLSPDMGIIASILLPIFGIIIMELSLFLYKKIFKTPFKIACIYGLIDWILIVILFFAGKYSLLLTVILLTLLFGITCVIINVLISFVPKYFLSTGKISTIASILNAGSCIGSAFAIYVIGYVSRGDIYGWTGAIICWLIISSVLVLASIMTMFFLKKTSLKK